MVPMLLKNQVALITGSGRGIGRAIAHLFAKEGASAFLTARTEKERGAVAKEIAENGGRAEYAMADLTQEAACTRVVAAVREKFGRVDILVNNTGHYGPVVPVEEYPLAEFDKVIAVHLRAAFLLSQLVLPEMYARSSGVILNISSLSAKAAYADRKSTRLNSSHRCISYAVFCLKKKKIRPSGGWADLQPASEQHQLSI